MWGELVGIILQLVGDSLVEATYRALGWIGCLVLAVASIGLLGLTIFLLTRS